MYSSFYWQISTTHSTIIALLFSLQIFLKRQHCSQLFACMSAIFKQKQQLYLQVNNTKYTTLSKQYAMQCKQFLISQLTAVLVLSKQQTLQLILLQWSTPCNFSENATSPRYGGEFLFGVSHCCSYSPRYFAKNSTHHHLLTLSPLRSGITGTHCWPIFLCGYVGMFTTFEKG